MAGKGRKTWTGETLSVPDLQDYLQDQVVMAFDNTAERDAEIPAPTDGMHIHLRDVGRTLVRVLGGWRDVAAQPRAQLYARTADAGSGIPTGYWTVTLGGETSDTHGGHAIGAAGYTVPPGQGGTWRASGSIGIGQVGGVNASGITCGGRFMVNGATPLGSAPVLMPVSSSNGCVLPLPPTELPANAGDVITMQAYVGTGGWSYFGSDTAGSSTCRMLLERISS